ncbi:hypothetical protein [Aldersonia kunmingensis]|uniref:hypothetical protein n=1 Tax=Aldersonia kunmingensis TaxID=408066 RepID=UPI0012ECF8BD|nr:hypothetical protein [Aldersonia kunmingensis]
MAGTIFAATPDNLVAIPPGGGVPNRIAGQAVDIAIDGDTVYYTEWGAIGSVRSVPANGGIPQIVQTDLSWPTGVAVAGGDLYVATTDGIVSVPTGGGIRRPVAPLPDPFTIVGLAIAGDTLFASSGHKVYSVPLRGGLLTQVYDAGGNVLTAGIAVYNDRLFIAQMRVKTTGNVVSIPLRGGQPVEVAGNLDNPRGVAVDSSGVYVSELGKQIVATCGGNSRVLARGDFLEGLEVAGASTGATGSSDRANTPGSAGSSDRDGFLFGTGSAGGLGLPGIPGTPGDTGSFGGTGSGGINGLLGLPC